MSFRITNIEKHHKSNILKLIEVINTFDKLEYSLTDEWLDYIIENASEAVFLGFHEEDLVGLATAMINPVYKDQSALNVLVHPKYRKKGLGSILYKEVDKFAREKGVKILEAYVKKRLIDGVRFAEKRGTQSQAPLLGTWYLRRLKCRRKLLKFIGDDNLEFQNNQHRKTSQKQHT